MFTLITVSDANFSGLVVILFFSIFLWKLVLARCPYRTGFETLFALGDFAFKAAHFVKGFNWTKLFIIQPQFQTFSRSHWEGHYTSILGVEKTTLEAVTQGQKLLSRILRDFFLCLPVCQKPVSALLITQTNERKISEQLFCQENLALKQRYWKRINFTM